MAFKREQAITWAVILEKLIKLTPEQLAHPVLTTGDDRGDYVGAFEVLADDQVNPSGDGMEPRTEWIKEVVTHEGYTQEDAEAEHIVAPKGMPMLVID